jgi:hypothetical protein
MEVEPFMDDVLHAPLLTFELFLLGGTGRSKKSFVHMVYDVDYRKRKKVTVRTSYLNLFIADSLGKNITLFYIYLLKNILHVNLSISLLSQVLSLGSSKFPHFSN